jgi:hypothetical protein
MISLRLGNFVIASEAKQSILAFGGAMDRFARDDV